MKKAENRVGARLVCMSGKGPGIQPSVIRGESHFDRSSAFTATGTQETLGDDLLTTLRSKQAQKMKALAEEMQRIKQEKLERAKRALEHERR